MHDISKHDPEEERECYDGEYSWVHFLKQGDSISIHDLLEGHSKVICFKESWFHVAVVPLISTVDGIDLRTIYVSGLAHGVYLVLD